MPALNIALDGLSRTETIAFIEKHIIPLSDTEKSHIHFKVNDFLALVGIDGIRSLHEEIRERFGYEFQWMIDGKWNDIPNTVANYARRLTGFPVAYYTVHANA